VGIVLDALAIVFSCLFGSKLHKKSENRPENNNILGICIIIVSMVGFFENIYSVDKSGSVVSEDLLVVLFAYFCGSKIGYFLRIEDRLSNVGKSDNSTRNAIIDAVLFFAVGGLQISGPIAMVIQHDNTQMLIKSAIDVAFGLAFGAAYGKVAAFAAIPVAVTQMLIAAAAYLSADFFTARVVAQLCAVGYIVLFFSGFNLMVKGRYKIDNVNMLPGIFLILLINIISAIIKI